MRKIIALVTGLVWVHWASAAPLTVPHTFTAHQTLRASDLNDNFAADAASINAVSSDQIVDGTINTQDLGTSSVTTAKIADGTVAPVDATTRTPASGTVVTSLTFDTTETTVVTLGALVTTGGNVLLVGASAILAQNLTNPDLLTVRLKRSGSTILTLSYLLVSGGTREVPLPQYLDVVAAGSYTYSITVQAGLASTNINTGSSNAGVYFAKELL